MRYHSPPVFRSIRRADGTRTRKPPGRSSPPRRQDSRSPSALRRFRSLMATPSSAAERARAPGRDPERVPLFRFLAPKYWPVWLGLGFVRLANVLPLPAQLAIGRCLGRLAWRLSRRDRRIAEVNVALCLPELSQV